MQPVQPMPVQKKGTSIWVWLAIGCVGLIVVCGIAFAGFGWWAAHKVKSIAQDYKDHPETAWIKTMAMVNPDVEVVSTDDANGKVTLKNKKTGEVVTLDMKDVKEGKISFTSDKGTSSINMDQQSGQMKVETTNANGQAQHTTATFGGGAKVPDWVPAYPGATSQGVYSAEDDKQMGGTFGLDTGDSVDQVFANLKGQLESAGYKVTETRYNGPQGMGGLLAGESKDGKRTVTYTMSNEGGKTKVAGVYSEKKGA
jgi:hypothetical protein